MTTRIISNYLDSNVFVLEKEGHCLIIDAGADFEKVNDVVGENIVDGILLTHGHYDHSFYCNDYSKFFKAPIYANENVKTTLSDGEANCSHGNLITDFLNFNLITEDCKLKIGRFDVECLSTKGHSQCSECYLIEGNLFAGDVLFENGIGRTDLKGSNKKEMLETLNKLGNIAFEKVCSGHGASSDFSVQKKNISIFKRFLSR